MMEFLFEVKFKNGKVQTIRIRANIATEALKELMGKYNDISSYKILS